MSALEAGPLPDQAAPPRRRLTLVAPDARPIRRTPFLLILAILLGVGMIGLLVLNTSLQNQAFAARTLNREASLLANQQAQLQGRVDELRTPQTLAEKAAALGLRPNQYPAFVKLPEGKIVGSPQRVQGGPLPSWLRDTPEEIARAKAAEAARVAAEKKAAEKKAADKKAADKKAADKKAAQKKAAQKKAAQKTAAQGAAAKKKNAKPTSQKPSTTSQGR